MSEVVFLVLFEVLRTGELVEMAREHAEHRTRLREFTAPQSMHRDPIQERTQSLGFIVGVAPRVELSRFGQELEAT